jgi:hypothetical protein
VDDIALYYSFIFKKKQLLASKYFSIFAEDYVNLKYTEKIVNTLCVSENVIIKPQPGINTSAITKSLIHQTLKRFVLPENGERKIPPYSFVY